MHTHMMKSMALTHILVAALSLAFFVSGSEAGTVGVCYGMLGNNLMQPAAVVQLLKNNCIKMVRLYDADAVALRALANTGIKVGVSLRNQYLADAAGSMAYARRWVRSNVKAYYPNTLIQSVDVGNEVFKQAPELTRQLLPAMKNIQAALASFGLADAVKVTTPIAFDALKVPSWPPSVGEFRDDIAQSVMSPMLDFLDQTCSHLSFNIYPYIAYKEHPDETDLDYVLFRPNNGYLDDKTGLTYYSMFDAMVDAAYHAVEKLSSSRRRARGRMLKGGGGSDSNIVLTETGLPHRGKIGAAALKSVDHGSTTANAKTYNSNLIGKVLRGTGTPYKPDANISVYIFSLFNENQKPGDDDERNFGLFYPDGTPVYNLDFDHPVPAPANPNPAPAAPSWCVANATVGEKRLQDALDYACGHGADCGAIKTGGRCFDPNTKLAHASYAFNDYYQHNGRTGKSCNFGGCGYVVHQQPKFGSCVL